MFKNFYRKNKGSLTIEAAIVLPIVIITLLFIANILNICMVNTCMQQSLNNTAKKISQDSYFVYRFAGEENYTKFINFLSKTNDGYNAVNDKAKNTSDRLGEIQTSAVTTLHSFDIAKNTFATYEPPENITEMPAKVIELLEYCDNFVNNVKDLLDKCRETIDASKNFASSIKELTVTGKENITSVVVKLLIDTGTGFLGSSIAEMLFNKYTDELDVPASKITDLNFFHSSLNADGSVTLVITYNYKNPFSFVNQKSLEYSVINRNIRMTNAITVKPFVGKNGTSLIGNDSVGTSSSDDKNEILVWISNSAYEVSVDDRKYHSRPDCGTMTAENSTQVKLSDAKNSSKITGPCAKCFPGGEPTSE